MLTLSPLAERELTKSLHDFPLLLTTGIKRCLNNVWHAPTADAWKIIIACGKELLVWSSPQFELAFRLRFQSKIIDFDMTRNSSELHIGVVTSRNGWAVVDGQTGSILQNHLMAVSKSCRVFVAESLEWLPQLVIVDKDAVFTQTSSFRSDDTTGSTPYFIHPPNTNQWHVILLTPAKIDIIEGPNLHHLRSMTLPLPCIIGILSDSNHRWKLIVHSQSTAYRRGNRTVWDPFSTDPPQMMAIDPPNLPPWFHGLLHSTVLLKTGTGTYSVPVTSSTSIGLLRIGTKKPDWEPPPSLPPHRQRFRGKVEAIFIDPEKSSRHLGVFLRTGEVVVTHMDYIDNQIWTWRSPQESILSATALHPESSSWQLLVADPDGIHLLSKELKVLSSVATGHFYNLAVLNSKWLAAVGSVTPETDDMTLYVYDTSNWRLAFKQTQFHRTSLHQIFSCGGSTSWHILAHKPGSHTLAVIRLDLGSSLLDQHRSCQSQVWYNPRLKSFHGITEQRNLIHLPEFEPDQPTTIELTSHAPNQFSANSKLRQNVKHPVQPLPERSDLFILWERPLIWIYSFTEPKEPLAELFIDKKLLWWFDTPQGIALAFDALDYNIYEPEVELVYLDLLAPNEIRCN